MTAPPIPPTGNHNVNSAHFTIQDVYAQGLSTDRKVDLLVQTVTGSNGTTEQITELKTRVRLLEQAKWPLPSLAALLGVAGLVWQFISAAKM